MDRRVADSNALSTSDSCSQGTETRSLGDFRKEKKTCFILFVTSESRPKRIGDFDAQVRSLQLIILPQGRTVVCL